jgi:carbon storage regulator
MLVLSRQRDETIIIGDDIEITVVDIRGEKVRLGINAPAHIPVHRKEVYDAIKREKEAEAAEGKVAEAKVESLANRHHHPPKRPRPPRQGQAPRRPPSAPSQAGQVPPSQRPPPPAQPHQPVETPPQPQTPEAPQ